MADQRLDRYREISRKVREIPLETAVTSHEWEELVQNLCTSSDEHLREIGLREMRLLHSRVSDKVRK